MNNGGGQHVDSNHILLSQGLDQSLDISTSVNSTTDFGVEEGNQHTSLLPEKLSLEKGSFIISQYHLRHEYIYCVFCCFYELVILNNVPF